MDKENAAHIHNGTVFSLKNGNPDICNTGKPRDIKPDTVKQILHDLTYTWNIKKTQKIKTSVRKNKFKSFVVQCGDYR